MSGKKHPLPKLKITCALLRIKIWHLIFCWFCFEFFIVFFFPHWCFHLTSALTKMFMSMEISFLQD